MATDKIGIVTVTYNSAGFLAEFEQSLREQTHANWTVYCIDNASADATPALLDAMDDPRWRITLNENNTGVAAGNNQGILQALQDRCDWVLLLNNDTSFDPRFLKQLLEGCRSRQWRVAVPKIHFDEPKGSIWYGGGGFNPRRGHTGFHTGIGEPDEGQFDAVTTVAYSPTCSMIIGSDVFSEVGLMDESYFVYFDDTDFCLRLERAGIEIGYWPGATLIHKVGGSTGGGASPFTAKMTSRNRLYYLRKHFGTLAALAWMPIFLVYYFVEHGLMKGNLAALKASFKGSFSYFAMRPNEPRLDPR